MPHRGGKVRTRGWHRWPRQRAWPRVCISRSFRALRAKRWTGWVRPQPGSAHRFFRAATVRNILDFPQQFTPPAHVITLEQNYRSTQPILDVTNTVISRATERFTKNLWTRRVGGESPWLVTIRDEQEQTGDIEKRSWIVVSHGRDQAPARYQSDARTDELDGGHQWKRRSRRPEQGRSHGGSRHRVGRDAGQLWVERERAASDEAGRV